MLAIGAILIDTKYVPILDFIPDLFLTRVELAKVILGTLSGSLLTITTFTFSTIMVVLTMYSSNFSPRVVNNFLYYTSINNFSHKFDIEMIKKAQKFIY